LPLRAVHVQGLAPARLQRPRPEGLQSGHSRFRDPGTALATLYKRGPAYYLNWREDGRQLRRSLGAIERKEAEALRAKKEAELAGLIAPQAGVTVKQVIDDYLEWYETARPATFGRVKSALKPLLNDLGGQMADGVSPRTFEVWAVGRPPATTEKALKSARTAFRRAVDHRILARSPMDGAKFKKAALSRPPDYYKPEQLARLYKTARGPLWALMTATGVRRGEMAKARRSDVREGLLVIESTAEGRTKSGKWRAVPLNKQAKDALKALGADRLVDVHPDTLSDWFAKDAQAAGLPGSLHWLRHTFCTALVQAGVSLYDVMKLAGHSSIKVTERYAHHAPGFGAAAVATMAGWMRKGLARSKVRASGSRR
jgi:integrase